MLVYDDTERVVSTTARVGCYATIQLSSLRLVGGGINNFVPSGRTGWIRFTGGGRPLLGASIQRGSVFSGGHNLHALTLLPTLYDPDSVFRYLIASRCSRQIQKMRGGETDLSTPRSFSISDLSLTYRKLSNLRRLENRTVQLPLSGLVMKPRRLDNLRYIAPDLHCLSRSLIAT